ncbi:hypothetical protein EJ06DRAFT_519412 [Trichodelitschia bisporula]|uniref:Uncharacterized protein n=1 Tax=Trichodelitschia bisporula TaxID=703511 RepID=A0A6G1I6C8_9PEZI|nr:hypothetical protein EJ06DRAFT_519412 [Trichodelitschia bisporula]
MISRRATSRLNYASLRFQLVRLRSPDKSEGYYTWLGRGGLRCLRLTTLRIFHLAVRRLTAIEPATEPTNPAPEAIKPALEPTQPAGKPTDPTPEAIKPAPESTNSELEAIIPAPEPTEPAPKPTGRAPGALKPVLEPTRPAPKPTAPPPEAIKPAPKPANPTIPTDNINPLLLARSPPYLSAFVQYSKFPAKAYDQLTTENESRHILSEEQRDRIDRDQ